MAQITSSRDLDAYRQSLREAKRLFDRTRSWPEEERYALADQICRSSRAVGAPVAEAWGRRRYQGAFAEKLTQAWLGHARLAGYLSQAEYDDFDTAWGHIGGWVRRMIQRADRFVEH